MTWFTNLIGLADDIPYFFWKTEEQKKRRQGRTASIKGHDTDRWGRNWVTSELNSDFEPGSSWRRHKTPYETRQEKTEEQNLEYLSASTQVGSALHSLVEKQMLLSGMARAVEVPVFDKETGNSGFVDIIGAEGQPIDIKTLDPTGWGKLLRTGKASPEHWAQLQGYLQALDKESGELIYMPRDDPENRIVINVKRDRTFGKYGIEPAGEEEQSFRQSRAQEVYGNSEEILQRRYQGKLEWAKELEVQRSNNIKGHDAGRWGREWVTTAVGSDFSPGASYLCPVGKTFVSLLGTKFENIIKSPVFQKALESGTPLEKLGTGVFGEVWKMKTTFGGEEFTYVKKIQRGNPSNIMTEADYGGMRYEHKAMEDIRIAEGGIAKDIAHSYGVNKEGTVLYQEYLEGRVAGVETTEKQALGFLGIIGRLAKKGFAHGDISLNNLFIHQSGQPMMVDVGLLRRANTIGKSSFVEAVLTDVEDLNKVVQTSMKFQALQTGKFNARISEIGQKSQEIITKAISEESRQIQQMSHDAVCVQNLRDMNPKRIKR